MSEVTSVDGGRAISGLAPVASYRWSIDFFTEQGARVGSSAIEPDWEPAIECARFTALRRGLVSPTLGGPGGVIEPLWHTELGAPILSAARVGVRAEVGDEVVFEDVSARGAFFRDLAKEASSELIEQGLLSEGQRFRFKVAAYPCSSPGGPRSSPGGPSSPHGAIDPNRSGGAVGGATGSDAPAGFVFEEPVEALPLLDKPVEALAASARAIGREADEGDMRVFVPQEVLDEALALAKGAGGLEVGGVLLGHLHRDLGGPEIYLEVTAQVPALHTDATNASLTFTADSWAAARAAVDLRARGELIVGWHHFHPDFGSERCAGCPEERRRRCVLSQPFFSTTDIHMHRTVFPRAFHCALLVSDLGRDELDVSFYGWRHGVVAARGFEVLDGPPEAARPLRENDESEEELDGTHHG